MRAFSCTCGQPLFFDNLRCLACGSEVGCDPRGLALGPIDEQAGGVWALRGDARRPVPLFRLCAHRDAASACNWMLSADESGSLCISCRATRTIPDLTRPRNEQRLRAMEAAKRRAFFNLQSLSLPLVSRAADPARGLAFDFLESIEGGPQVMTGHAAGVITINVAEADDDYRERNRDALAEPYRTIIGHLRHELGHYYWDVLVKDSLLLEDFRTLFGDERDDYGAALHRHYSAGAPPNWRDHFISSYAASHPWEDWAETWAHFLHMRSTLETVASYHLDASNVALQITPFGHDVLHDRRGGAADDAFLGWVNAWVVLTAVLNETARSMGQPDIYPFVLNGPVVTKLHFVHGVVMGERRHELQAPPEHLKVI